MPDELNARVEQIRADLAGAHAQLDEVMARAELAALELRELRVSEVRIADMLGVDRRTVRRWFGKPR